MACAVLGLVAGPGWAEETFIWTQVASEGLWSDTDNWGGGVSANGDGNTGDFSTLDITADNTVHLDSSVTIGNLIFDDNNKSWILDNNGSAANVLTLSGTTPTIEVIRKQATISAVIDGTSGLTKSGTGTLWLSGTNTYTGGTVINAGGTVRINSDAGLGDTSGAVTVNNSFTLLSSSNITLNRDFALSSGTIMSYDVGSNNKDNAITGAVTGDGGIYITSTLGLQLTSTSNTFTGPISMGDSWFAGRLYVNSIGDAPGAGTIQIGSANKYGAGTFEYSSGAIAPLVLNHRQIDIASPGGNAYLRNNAGDANTITINTDVLSTVAGSKNLVLGGGNTGDNEIAGAIGDGTGGGVVRLTKENGGTWILSGNNTYTGGTTVTSGTLKANAAGALSTGDVTVTGGTLVIDVADAMADTASLSLPSATTMNLTMNANDTVAKLFFGALQQPNNTYTSSGAGSAWMNIGVGTLTVGTAATQPLYWDLNGTDANACAGGNTAAGTWDGAGAIIKNWNTDSTGGGGGTIGVWSAGATAVFAAGTDATGTYVVTVDGTRDIGGLTFEEGDVTLSGGALRMTADTLAYVNTALTATISTPISNDATPRSFTKGGPGTLTLTTANTYTGETIVNDGRLRLTNADAIGGSSGLTLAGGAVVLDTNVNLNEMVVQREGTAIGATDETHTLNFGGAATITVDAVKNVIIRTGITGSPTLNYTGKAGDNSSPLTLAPTADVTMTLGAITATRNPTKAKNMQLYLAGDSTGNSAGSITWSPPVGQQLTVYKQGASTWTVGTLTLNAGRLNVDSGTLVVTGANNVISHAVNVNSTGRLVSGGAYTLVDTREVFKINSGGTVAPGNNGVGTMTVGWSGKTNDAATLTLATGSTYEWEIGDDGSGNVVTDILNLKKPTAKAATLSVADMTLKILDAGGSVASDDQLPVFTYDTGVTRSLGTVTFDTDALGASWDWSAGLALTDGGSGIIYLTGLSSALPGDADDNGVVNAADYIILKTHMGTDTGAKAAEGDFNGDGTVNYADLVLLQDNFGKSSAGATGTIPEPATLGLLAIGGLAMLKRRRHT